MEPPAIPSDEVDRLEAVRALELLDTPQEERFDRITRTARRLLHVPISLVTLIDADRQWFKSCQGVELDFRETPRDISFCGHAILKKQAFIIPNAARDKRFADNPLVTGPWHVRFYAGIPIATLAGHRVGTLCVIDTEPREPSEEDLDGLVDLASWAEAEIQRVELSRALRDQST
jgi:GAF domain-containing protein